LLLAGCKAAPAPRATPMVSLSEVKEAAPRAEPEPTGEPAQPCKVELEHTFRDVEVSDETWKTRRVLVERLEPSWEEQWEAGREDIAPLPLTFEEARAKLPDVTAVEDAPAERPVLIGVFSNGSISYVFDAEGRTIEVDWDPYADSAVYRYRYDCGG
jgi:hypothetical protein